MSKGNKDKYVEFIKKNRNLLTNKEIADELQISQKYVYTLCTRVGLPTKISYDISGIKEQIILSGILGDGNLKKNGKINYYYRECHSILEEEYLLWKYNNLGLLTKNMKILDIPSREINQNPQKEFMTRTMVELVKYAEMSKLDIISQLDELGLILYILDDGWKHKYSKKIDSKYNINLAVDGLTPEEREALVKQFKNELNINCKIINKLQNAISFSYDDNEIFIKILEKFGLRNLDVSIKKF